MKKIPLTQGQTTEVDDKDFDWLTEDKWCADKIGGRFYAESRKGGKVRRMHRLIMGSPKGKCVDHIDGDSLNNQRSNLRVCTIAENARNQHSRRGTSKYRGVRKASAKCNKTNTWVARIMVSYKEIHLGYFLEEIDAAKAYDKAAIEYHGEYANINFKGDNNV